MFEITKTENRHATVYRSLIRRVWRYQRGNQNP